jgi:hypothetical protein
MVDLIFPPHQTLCHLKSTSNWDRLCRLCSCICESSELQVRCCVSPVQLSSQVRLYGRPSNVGESDARTSAQLRQVASLLEEKVAAEWTISNPTSESTHVDVAASTCRTVFFGQPRGPEKHAVSHIGSPGNVEGTLCETVLSQGS